MDRRILSYNYLSETRLIMSKRPTLLQHFRSFAYQNNIKDFDKALAYFTVFGGTGWEVDASRSLDELIEEKVLRNYDPFIKA